VSADERAIYELHRDVSFDRPVLVVGLEGWIDSGMGTVNALASLLSTTSAEPIVTFDADHLLDQRARRPVARITDGVTTELTWPQTEMRAGHDLRGADVLFLVGAEPDFHWRAFIGAVRGLAVRWGVRLVVGLGAFPAPAPHTRPVRLAATAPPSSAHLLGQVGVVQGQLEVPAGIHAALELAFDEAGIEAISLWARVPHYVAAMPFPEASAALVDGLASLSGLVLDSSELRAAADASRRQVDQLIAEKPEHVEMVAKLEQVVDTAEGNALDAAGALPTGEELAAEFERYLRGEDH
jgi:proteasome assembly chaperone (PAC2) family protein